MRVVSIGDLVTDFYYQNNKLIGTSGGMSAHNIIANLSYMQINTKAFGVCGDDEEGKIAIKSLKDLKVDTDNIKISKNIKTRCFHIYISKGNINSKKRCQICGAKKWYSESQIDVNNILKNIDKEDILVFDSINDKNEAIISNTQNKKMLDLGQAFELEKLTKNEIKQKLYNKFEIINLNERVAKYLKIKLDLNSDQEIYKMLKPKLLIITKGKNGADFIFNNIIIKKSLENKETEIDEDGAGDAFFAKFIYEYIKNNYQISKTFIDSTFIKATNLTKQVVQKIGARGHLKPLYKIKTTNNCPCQTFKIINRKPVKKSSTNVINLKPRIINAINSKAYLKIKEINFKKLKNSLFIGTGGSFAAAKFSAKVINHLYKANTLSIFPRDFYSRNNQKIDCAFLFTYSGTTNDIISIIPNINNKYIITKSNERKINLNKENIISYQNNNKRERGFLSFEGVLAPASLFLKLYLNETQKEDAEIFIKNRLTYWNQYFKNYFKCNKEILNKFLAKGSTINIFTGDYTECGAQDLESKIIESGIYNCIIHEKKNFSHGRFINYENLSEKKNIYFKQKNASPYEAKLLDYLKDDDTLIIESAYNGILCEYDLLISVQYLIYYIANFLDIDLSSPIYSNKAMELYFYKGDL